MAAGWDFQWFSTYFHSMKYVAAQMISLLIQVNVKRVAEDANTQSWTSSFIFLQFLKCNFFYLLITFIWF